MGHPGRTSESDRGRCGWNGKRRDSAGPERLDYSKADRAWGRKIENGRNCIANLGWRNGVGPEIVAFRSVETNVQRFHRRTRHSNPFAPSSCPPELPGCLRFAIPRRTLRAENEPKPAKKCKTVAKTPQKTMKKAGFGKNGMRATEREHRRRVGAATWNFVISESESLSPVWAVGLDSAGFWTYSTTAEFCAGSHCACRNANVTGRTGRNWVRKFDRNHRAQDIKQTKGD